MSSSSRVSNGLRARAAWALLALAAPVFAQTNKTTTPSNQAAEAVQELNAPALRARRFLAGRTTTDGTSSAAALHAARSQHLEMTRTQVANAQAAGSIAAPRSSASPRLDPASLTATWTAVGPAQVASQRYGLITGRVTSVAIDPADASGNTVYLGTTGGGVWRSVNAAGPAANVSFMPLTDTLPVFSANAGGVAIPSLSIGAVSIGGSPGVLLAGTGDPNDASDSYYGEGILRSTDGGSTWTLVQQSNDGIAGNHSFVGLGVAGFAWSTATPNLVVTAISQSREGVVVDAPNTIASAMGLYYSTDAGVTWKMSTIEDGTQYVQNPTLGVGSGNAVTSVVWNAVRQRFYAAVRYHGYYESADGIAWTRLASQPGPAITLVACPTLGARAGCPLFRGTLAVEPVTGDTFALTVDGSNNDQGLWRDVCALSGSSCATSPIAFGTQMNSTPLEAGSGSTAIAQGDYDLSLAAVHAGTDTLLFAGTVDLYRCSLTAGCTLRNTTNATNGCAAPAKVAPAQHAIAAVAGAGSAGTPLLFFGNDGGLWRSLDGVNQQQAPCSTDDASHFDDLNGGLGSLAEVVSLAQHPSDGGTLLAGLGADGTASTSSAPTQAAWPQIASGEGGVVAIDRANPLNWYLSNGAGVSVQYCGRGSACTATDFAGSDTIGYAQVGEDSSLAAPPLLLDPAAQSEMLLGTCRVWRGAAQSGAGWSAISTQLGSTESSACTSSSAMVRSLAAGGPVQTSGSTVLYAGVAGTSDGGSASLGGHIFANIAAGSASASTAWSDTAGTNVTNDVADAGRFNPGGFDVSSLTADPHDGTGMTVYATVMGFSGNGVNAPHLYRSTDGGAHWTNISSNLPNAPANALAVDPNDANTLYVAMDTGVYVTNSVTSCTSGNCWSVYGAGLPNAPVTALAASAQISAGSGLSGELRAATYGRGIWQIPLLSALPAMNPAMTLAPTSLSFAAQPVAVLSAPQTIMVTNTGEASLAISRVATTGDFVETDNCVGTGGSGIAPGASCSVQVNFLPSTTGTRTGVLTIYGNVPGGQATASLSGTGTPGSAIVLNPIIVTYSGTNVGSTSAAQSITLTNNSGASVNLQAETVSGDFTVSSNTCGSSLVSNRSCVVSVEFKPTAAGSRTGNLTVTDAAGTQTAFLSGIGALAATDTLAPASLSFGAQALNVPSMSQQVMLANNGDVALTLISAQTTGDFGVVNSCGNSLNGHSSCAMLVTFTPKTVGPETGTLTINDALRTQTVALKGIGIAPTVGVSISPVGSMNFAATGVGIGAASQAVTLTNNGAAALAIQSIATTGDFAIVTGSNKCGVSLAVGAVCTMQIAFTATAAGARAGVLTITDSAPNSPQTLALSGIGIDFALTASGSSSATISAGSQATYALLVSSNALLTGTVALSCAPVPAHGTCVVNPSIAPLGGTTSVAVTVATSVASLEAPHLFSRGTQIWLVAALPLGLAMRRRRRIFGLVVVGALLAIGGCASSRVIPEGGSSGGGGGTGTGPPTPGGSYSFTITGTSSGLTRSVELTLIVQ